MAVLRVQRKYDCFFLPAAASSFRGALSSKCSVKEDRWKHGRDGTWKQGRPQGKGGWRRASISLWKALGEDSKQAGRLTADCTNNIADSTVMSPLKPDAAPRPSLRRSDSRELDGHRSGGGHSGSTLHSFHNFRTWASFHPSASAASPLALLQLCCQNRGRIHPSSVKLTNYPHHNVGGPYDAEENWSSRLFKDTHIL